ncbi:MAG: hypothetical protein VXZ72_03780, partial [Chlamydiota bacterium]|nr:hypothetical protein [Chlamydiota bacterium]
IKLCHLLMMACEEATKGTFSFNRGCADRFNALPRDKQQAVQKLMKDPEDAVARERVMRGIPKLTPGQHKQIQLEYQRLKDDLQYQDQGGSWMSGYKGKKRREPLSRRMSIKKGMRDYREMNLSHDLIDLAVAADDGNIEAIHRLKEEVEAIDSLLNEKMPRIREALALDNKGEISMGHVQEEWRDLLNLSRHTKNGKAHSPTLQQVIDRGHLSSLTQKEREAIKGLLETEEMGHKHALQVATQKLSMGQHQYLLVIDILRKTLESQTRAGERIAQKQY